LIWRLLIVIVFDTNDFNQTGRAKETGQDPAQQLTLAQFRWLVKSTIGMPSIPKMVLDRYQNRPQACFFDVMPEIHRAWASIDNTLYIWRLGEKYADP
jgi:hypothetical protein